MQTDYEPKVVFRGITRNNGTDFTPKKADFLSYVEQGRRCSLSDIGSYSCSLYKNKNELVAALYLPKPNRKIFKGTIKPTFGPIGESTSDSHIHLWLFENSDPSHEFEVDYDETE